MIKYVFLLFCPLLSYSQTLKEREKIIAQYDHNASLELINSLKNKSFLEKNDVKKFLATTPVLIEEGKFLKKICNGFPVFYTLDNAGSSITINTVKLYPGNSLGLNITGSGMIGGVWDGGKVRNTHIELTGRVFLSDNASALSPHATHVSGTIIATGLSPARKGIAYQASLKTYDWDTDELEMAQFGSEGYIVSNHSYGYDATTMPTWLFGSYDSAAIDVDNISNTYPYYQIVKSAGNSRNDFDISQVADKSGYDLLGGAANAKNIITVAAVNEVDGYIDENSVLMSDFSNFGPTDDGRIKPDISAKGVDVNSTISTSNNAYDIYSGTSMASPAITGMILLLQKHYSNIHSSLFMRASTVRGLICHSAREAGMASGPDYEFGWGLADSELAASIISNSGTTSLLEEDTLSNNDVFVKNISIDTPQKLMFTICWTDPTGVANVVGQTDNRSPRLVNNLDLKVIKDNTIFYPWKLDVENPTFPATNTSDNDVDNIEKVEIDNALPGTYTIQVSHKGNLKNGLPQIFSLIASNITGSGLNVNSRDYDNVVFIYPNPTKNILNYQVKEGNNIDTITINDISGKMISNVNVNPSNSFIDVSNLSSGIYFVDFKSENQIITKKIIKN